MKSIILLSLLSSCLAMVFQHTLIKFESKKSKMIKDGTWEAYLKTKNFLALAGINSQPIFNFDDAQFLINVTVGTPDQAFQVLFDTSSADFWIHDVTACSNKCPTYCTDSTFCSFVCNSDCCGSSKKGSKTPCTIRTFNSSESTTYSSTGSTINYGNLQAILGMDTVRFGSIGDPELTIANTNFGQAIQMDALPNGIDGIMGLGFQGQATQNIVPPLINAINQGLLDKPLFTVYLGASDGMITYGGIDSAHCNSDITYYPLTSDSSFQFTLDSVAAGGFSKKDTTPGWDAIADTGTMWIAGPSAATDPIAVQVGAVYDGNTGLYVVDCAADFQPITFTIGGKGYPIEGKKMIINDGSGGNCYFALYSMNTGGFGPQWFFGDTWHQSYCTIYGLGDKTIGFAKVVNS